MTHQSSLPIIPPYLSLTQRPLLLWPAVIPDYDRQLSDYRLSMSESGLLTRFKKMKKGRSVKTPPSLADARVSLVRLPCADAMLTDDAAPKFAEMVIEGPLLQKASWVMTEHGPCLIIDGYDRIGETLSVLGADETVKGIFIRMDSPGGVVSGCFELCQDWADRVAGKPVVVFNENLTCSAAYALAACADEIHASLTAMTGSVGVVFARYDVTRAMDKAGVGIHIFKSGEQKDWLDPQTVMSEAEAAQTAKDIAALADMFIDHVSQARGLTTQAVKAMEAGTYLPPDARSRGLIDNIGSLTSARLRLLDLIDARARGEAPAKPPEMTNQPTTTPSTNAQNPTAKETTMSKTPMSKLRAAGRRASLKTRVKALAARMIENDPDKPDAEDEELDTLAEEEVEQLADEDVKTMDEDEDVEALEEDEKLTAESDEDIEKAEAEEDENKTAPSAAALTRRIASRVANKAGGQGKPPAPKRAAETAPAAASTVEADRARMSAILALPEARGRQALAGQLAAQGLSVEGAKAALASAPKTAARTFAPPSPRLGVGAGQTPAKSAGDRLIEAAANIGKKSA